MSNINAGRVIGGGLVAGVVYNAGEAFLNLVILKDAADAMVKKLNIPPVGDEFIMKATFMMFVVGIVNVFLYAAIRPRFGVGPKTAVIAGLLVWFLGFVYFALMATWMGLFEMSPSVIGLAFELPEAILASLAGAWIYKE